MRRIISFLTVIIFLAVSQGWTLPNNPDSSRNVNSKEVHKNIRKKMKQIQMDLKAGKITEAQAQALRENLKSVHQQAVQYRRGNGNKDLTDEQKKKLNDSLGSDTGSR